MNRLNRSLVLLTVLFVAAPLQAGPVVGDVVAFYNAPNPYLPPSNQIQDGAVFVIRNSSALPLTNVAFTANGDTLNVGTIAANSNVVIEPGITQDGGTHGPGTFFSFLGTVLDESDSGPNSDSVPFRVVGTLGVLPIDTGTFTPAATVGPSNDGTIPLINFLGGGPNSDGACNNCFGPAVVAQLSLPAPVPEPVSLLLLGIGACAALSTYRRGSRAAADGDLHL